MLGFRHDRPPLRRAPGAASLRWLGDADAIGRSATLLGLLLSSRAHHLLAIACVAGPDCRGDALALLSNSGKELSEIKRGASVAQLIQRRIVNDANVAQVRQLPRPPQEGPEASAPLPWSIST